MNIKSNRYASSNKMLKLALCVFISFFLLCAPLEAKQLRTTTSNDGTIISYEVHGKGDTTLVFIHGWNCDSRYWHKQVPAFSDSYKILLIDLAGHGHSSSKRTRYTMQSFGEDVKAVVDAENSNEVILVGHSMGGAVIAEAAKLLPNKTIGLIGVDTLENIEYELKEENKQAMLAPLKQDFQTGCGQFASSMIYNSTAPDLRNWIVTDMSAAQPRVALSAINEYFDQYLTGNAAKVFEEIKLPVFCINGDLWPINYEGNRRHMHSFEAVVLKESDHFLMLTHPEKFNKALEQVLKQLTPANQKK